MYKRPRSVAFMRTARIKLMLLGACLPAGHPRPATNKRDSPARAGSISLRESQLAAPSNLIARRRRAASWVSAPPWLEELRLVLFPPCIFRRGLLLDYIRHRMLSFVMACCLVDGVPTWFRLYGFPTRGEANELRNGGAGTSVHVPKNTTLYGEAGVTLSAFTCCFTSREV